MTDQELIRQLRIALGIAAMYARENPPAELPADMTLEEQQYLFIGTADDIFGERSIKYWLKQAKELMKNG